MNSSYSRSHFSWLPQAVFKGLMDSLSQKVSYCSMIIDTVIIGFSPDEVKLICTFVITQLSPLVYENSI